MQKEPEIQPVFPIVAKEFLGEYLRERKCIDDRLCIAYSMPKNIAYNTLKSCTFSLCNTIIYYYTIILSEN